MKNSKEETGKNVQGRRSSRFIKCLCYTTTQNVTTRFNPQKDYIITDHEWNIFA